jgi:hypothetical protein
MAFHFQSHGASALQCMVSVYEQGFIQYIFTDDLLPILCVQMIVCYSMRVHVRVYPIGVGSTGGIYAINQNP